MIKTLFQTDSRDVAATAARITLGVVMFPHGAQKVLGAFDGHGFSGTMGFFTDQLGIPAPLAAFAIITEFAAALALIVGVLTRPMALAMAGFMAVAMSFHFKHGFFMNWFGHQAGEGFEFHLLAIALAVVAILRGGGALSVDTILQRRLLAQQA